MTGSHVVQCPACHAAVPRDHPYGWCATCGTKLPVEVLRALGHPAVTPPGTPRPPLPADDGGTSGHAARPRHSPPAETLQQVDVLIVEDQEPVRAVMGKVLSQAGYTVRAVENGLAGLAAVQEGRFLAVICDLGMPLVDGQRFYEYLASGYPTLAKRVLFVTALSEAPAVGGFLKRTGQPVLQKPFEIKALVRAVAQVVGRPPTPGAML